MVIVDRGEGPPVVLVPGIQGRWEYLAPTVDALALSHRVLTFSLRDEPKAGWPSGAAAPSLDDFADQIGDVLADRGLSQAAVCGISFGGRIAIRFAARQPERVTALLVVSTPGPLWHLRTSHRLYSRAPA